MVPNPGYNAGLGQRSKIARLAWAWKGAGSTENLANVKERRLTSVDAVHEARELSETISRKLFKNGVSRRDAAVGLVFAKKKDLGKLVRVVPFRTPDPNADSHDLEVMRAHMHDIPVGFLVVVFDRANGNLISHARPLLTQKAAIKLLESVVDKAADIKDEDWRLN